MRHLRGLMADFKSPCMERELTRLHLCHFPHRGGHASCSGYTRESSCIRQIRCLTDRIRQCDLVVCASLRQQSAPEQGTVSVPRESLRLAIPSKGRMAEDTLQLLKQPIELINRLVIFFLRRHHVMERTLLCQDCQMGVHKPNPRQYTATISKLPELEVWFQRATDVVRKLLRGDVDLGIVGNDMYQEIAGQSEDLVIVHDALNFGHCHLGLGIPTHGKFTEINTLEQLRNMPDWTAGRPLQVVTGYTRIAERFFKKHGFEHVALSSADGALEAGPLMGTADIILDLVSTGVTLRENNLKEIEGGRILDSEGILVANRRSLSNPRLVAIVREVIERFEAHLKADRYFSVVANMRGISPEEVAARINTHPVLSGLEGPTIAEVFSPRQSSQNGSEPQRLFSATVCVPRKTLYDSINDLRAIGGSGVLVMPMTYIFDEVPQRWTDLLRKLQTQWKEDEFETTV